MMRAFPLTLAMRHLRSGGGQTLLTVGTVTMGVLLVVFASALMYGVRRHVREMLTDTLPHVVVQIHEREPLPLQPPAGGVAVAAFERQMAQLKEIDDGPRTRAILRSLPHVKAVAATVSGEASVQRGEKQVGALIVAADPAELDAVTPMTKYLTEGRFIGLRADEALLAYEVANDLRVRTGDRIRLIRPGDSQPLALTVGGIYDTGQPTRSIYLTLRTGQSLFQTGTAIRTLQVACDDLYDAAGVADRANALLPYEAKSWDREYPQFVSWMGIYGAIASLISGFTLVAMAFSIASILVVMVLQKGKQIGILKGIGAKSRQIMAVFLLEGLGIALVGGTLGSTLGILLVKALGQIMMPPAHPGGRIEPLFPFHLTPAMIGMTLAATIAATLLAAVIPARRAALLNPVEVLH
jgi:lipoprotein-releasing system permease protein